MTQVVGFGLACTQTTMLVVVAQYYPDKLGFARAVVETSIGVGVVFGPVLGGVLHSVGLWRSVAPLHGLNLTVSAD